MGLLSGELKSKKQLRKWGCRDGVRCWQNTASDKEPDLDMNKVFRWMLPQVLRFCCHVGLLTRRAADWLAWTGKAPVRLESVLPLTQPHLPNCYDSYYNYVLLIFLSYFILILLLWHLNSQLSALSTVSNKKNWDVTTNNCWPPVTLWWMMSTAVS